MKGDHSEVGARLRALLVAGDLRALRSYLDELDGDDLKAARRWASAKQDIDRYPIPPDLEPTLDDRSHDRFWQVRRGRLLTHARLSAPATAAKAVAAEYSYFDNPQHPDLIAAFVEHDRAWAAAFADAADDLGPSVEGAGTVALLLRAVVVAHHLPTPRGRLFHEDWIRQVSYSGTWTGHPLGDTQPVERVRTDPLVPEVVYRQLESGEVGRWPEFATILDTLVDEGWLDRGRLVSIALDQLTAGHKPSSQRVLARVLTELEVTADEVPGGLAYLSSVLSACHSGAAGVMLALALDLVQTGPDAIELAHVIAPRSEKGLRRTFLSAIAPDALGTRIPHRSLVDAIAILSASDDDLATRARYDKARAALGGTPMPGLVLPLTPAPLGLWDMQPTVPPRRPRGVRGMTLRDECAAVMRTGALDRVDDVARESVIDAVLRGELTSIDIVMTAMELAAEGVLSPVRAAHLLEPLILAGGMKEAWPAGITIAGLAASGPRPLTGIDRLVAMLSSYSAEPPRPVLVPGSLAQLAEGRSKAALEARQLIERTGASVAAPGLDETTLGLWDDRTEPSPSEVGYNPVRDLSTLRARLHEGPPTDSRDPGTEARIRRSMALDDLVALVAEHGGDVVRGAVVGDLPRGAWPVAIAVQLWASGALTTDTYWRLAATSRTTMDEDVERLRDLAPLGRWRLEEALAVEPWVMPGWWVDHELRLEFLHTCEVLLVVERGGQLVSTPQTVAGTVGLPRLHERLSMATRVGPLDLRLALARLAPFPAEALSRVVGSTPIDPAMTSPTGDLEQDAMDLLRTWVGAGGLTTTPGPLSGTLRTVKATSPLPWSDLAALAAVSVDDVPIHRGHDAWRLPGRPDAWLRGGLAAGWATPSLEVVGGRIDVTGWESIFASLGTPTSRERPVDFSSLVGLQRQGGLDPQVAVAAAARLWDAGQVDALGDVVGWEKAFLRGALRGLWPVAAALVEAGLAREVRPGGIDELVAAMRRFVPEVPLRDVPAFLVRP